MAYTHPNAVLDSSLDYRLVVAAIFGGFAVVELFAGKLLFPRETTRKDVSIEVGAGVLLPVLVVPTVLTLSAALTDALVPLDAGALRHWPAWLMLAVLLVVDDLTQYLWHRLCHASPKLYALHRAHHSAEYLSVRCVYRNNLIYYAFMPGLWLSGALLHLGFEAVYGPYYVAKMLVIIGAHSSVAWDEPLWRHRALRPLAWFLAHLFSTPRTHAAHHGKFASDGVTHYAGNYGNFLFLWDVLFGTAKFSTRRPERYGLENVEPMSWWRELLWPFRRR